MRYLAPLALAALAAVVLVLLAQGHGDRQTRACDRSGASAADPEYAPDGRFEGEAPASSGRRPNLVVLVIDGLRSDSLEPAEMPFLSELTSRGTHLTQVTAPAPGGLASLTSLLTGQRPDRHRVDDTGHPPSLPAGVTTFAEVLRAGHGYETAAVTDLPASKGLESVLQGFGFVQADAPLGVARAAIGAWNRERRKDRPFLLVLHAEEATAPYEDAVPPVSESRPDPRAMEGLNDAAFMDRYMTDRDAREAWLERAPGPVRRRAARYAGRGFGANPDETLRHRLQQAYRAEVRRIDGLIGRTVRHLEAEGLLQDTLLVVTSGHGEAFGEHGVLGHGRSLHEELVHVPLVLVGPARLAAGATTATSIGLVDLLPTFLDVAGLPPLTGIAGRSMAPALRAGSPGRAVLSMEEVTSHKMGRFAQASILAARTASETYIVTYDLRAGTIIERLYDRAADPSEQHDLATRGRVGTAPVSRTLAEAIESLRDRIWRSAASSQQFVQLGYGAGVGTVTSSRPPPPQVGTP